MEAKTSPEEPQEAGCPPCALGKAFSVDPQDLKEIQEVCAEYGAVVTRADYGLAYLVLFPTWPLA